MPRTSTLADLQLHRVREWQLRLFARYAALYLQRHFHGLHLWRPAAPVDFEGKPVLICMNHPSWWDPMVAIYLSQLLFRGRRQYAPIAAKGLEKYRIFENFGFFGIDLESMRGAQRFLRIGHSVLALENGVLWITAQGHFTDVRVRPVKLASGVGHLLHSAQRPVIVLPLALEYAFWDERTAEAFVGFGDTLNVDDGGRKTAAEWTALLSQRLEAAQDAMSARVLCRDPALFEPLIKGRAGVGGIYDVWRAAKATVRGKRFRAEHGGPLH